MAHCWKPCVNRFILTKPDLCFAASPFQIGVVMHPFSPCASITSFTISPVSLEKSSTISLRCASVRVKITVSGSLFPECLHSLTMKRWYINDLSEKIDNWTRADQYFLATLYGNCHEIKINKYQAGDTAVFILLAEKIWRRVNELSTSSVQIEATSLTGWPCGWLQNKSF